MNLSDRFARIIRRATALWLGAALVAHASPSIFLAMPPFVVSAEGDASAFATPIDTLQGYIVATFVTEPSSSSPPGYVSTTIRLGRKMGGDWEWQTKVIEPRTLLDPYHTQASVAFDRKGYIHVAYNMHNLPWQYMVSRRPFDISEFDNRGEQLSIAQLDELRLRNATNFPNQGNAAIPGNQITYPAFFKSAEGELFVAYRFAMKPARSWQARARAYGVARYDADKKTWTPVGFPFPLQTSDASDASPGTNLQAVPFAYDPNYQPYLVTLAIHRNVIHAVWTWWDLHSGQSGNITRYPSYLSVDLTTGMQLIPDVKSGRIPGWDPDTIFNTAKALAVAPNGDVLVLLEPSKTARQMVRRNHLSGNWSVPEDTPSGASKILIDERGNEWAIATGLNFYSKTAAGRWSGPIKVGSNLCDPRPVYSQMDRSIFVLSKNCDGRSTAVVHQLRLD